MRRVGPRGQDRRKAAGLLTGGMNRKPDFVIVGAAKAGTSSLYSYVSQHPQISMPDLKEPHFFSEWQPPTPAPADLGGYLSLFEGIPQEIRAGEASTSYLCSLGAPQNIKQFRPDAKIVMVLRNPVERAYSQYWNHVRDNVEPLSFEKALEAEPARVARGWWCGYHYVGCGLYSDQVTRYLELFGDQSVRIYLFEDLTRNAEAVCRDVFSFLQVDPDQPVDTRGVSNPSGPPKSVLVSRLLRRGTVLFRRYQRKLDRKGSTMDPVPVAWRRSVKEWLQAKNTGEVPKMDTRTKELLQDVFREDILRLEGVIRRDLARWLERPASA